MEIFNFIVKAGTGKHTTLDNEYKDQNPSLTPPENLPLV
jgi:hypothetical protein